MVPVVVDTDLLGVNEPTSELATPIPNIETAPATNCPPTSVAPSKTDWAAGKKEAAKANPVSCIANFPNLE